MPNTKSNDSLGRAEVKLKVRKAVGDRADPGAGNPVSWHFSRRRYHHAWFFAISLRWLIREWAIVR